MIGVQWHFHLIPCNPLSMKTDVLWPVKNGDSSLSLQESEFVQTVVSNKQREHILSNKSVAERQRTFSNLQREQCNVGISRNPTNSLYLKMDVIFMPLCLVSPFWYIILC